MFNSEKAGNMLTEHPQVKYLFKKVIPVIKDDETLGHVLFICPDMRLSEVFIHMLSERYDRNINVSNINIKASEMAAIVTRIGYGAIWAINNAAIDLKPDALDSLKKILYLHCIDIMIGKGSSAQSIRVDLPEFTFVACVERESDSLIQLYPFFEHIIEVNGTEILKLSKELYEGCDNVIITDEAYEKIWITAQKEANLAIKYLSRILAFWKMKEHSGIIDVEFVNKVFTALDVNMENTGTARK